MDTVDKYASPPAPALALGIDDATAQLWRIQLTEMEDRLRRRLSALMKPADHQALTHLAAAAEAARRILAASAASPVFQPKE